MVRDRYKIFAALTAVLLMLFALPLPAAAETKTVDIFNLESQSNMAVTLYYDVDEPTVSFIAPNGAAVPVEGLAAERGDKAVCYYIPNAMAGQWQMMCDKRGSKDVTVNWAPYANSLKIDSFDFTVVGNDSLEAKLKVTSDTDGNYSYAFYAVILDADGNINGKKQISSGTMRPSADERTVRFGTGSLQPYSGYRLYLEVWRSEYGLEASASALSDKSFDVAGRGLPEAIKDFHAEVNYTENTVTIDWSANSLICDEYIIGVFDAANGAEPIYANSFGNKITQTTVLFDPSVEKLRVELSYIRKKTSEPLKKEIPLKTGVEFTLPDTDVTSAKQISVGYSTSRKIAAHVSVNGNEQEISLESSGSFSVGLDEFDNEIRLSYSLDDENTVYVSTYKISVDTTAPILLLPENDVTLYVTESTFDLAGAAEAGCTVTVNGEPAALNSDGTFVHRLNLSDGENEFTVNAVDKAGNAASQLIVINKIGSAAAIGGADLPLWQKYLPLIIAFLSSVLLAALIFIFGRLYRQDRGTSASYAALSLVRNISLAALALAVCGTVYAAVRHFTLDNIVNSEKIFELAGDSIPEAYEVLKRAELFSRLFIIGVIATAAVCAVFVISLLLARRQKNRPVSADGAPPAESGREAIADVKPEPPSGTTAESLPPTDAPVQADTPPHTDAAVIPEQPAEPKTPAADSIICPKCGAKYNKIVKFCSKCGTKLEP